MTHPILGLVGPSGAGKTALILAMRERFPKQTSILQSLTTRACRDDQDALFYEFVSVDEVHTREREGRLVQVSEYAGNLYAHDRMHLERATSAGVALCAIVEHGVLALREAGYDIRTVQLIPAHATHLIRDEPARIQADAARATLITHHDFTLTNDFREGGWKTSVEHMAEIVESLIH